MKGISGKLCVLILTCSFVALCGSPIVLAYSYVDLAYLVDHLPSYFMTPVSTSGWVRTDIYRIDIYPTLPGQVFLATSVSSMNGVWLEPFYVGPHGSFINVSGTVVCDPHYGIYYLWVDYWEPAVWWNPADVNFDYKVDIFDCVQFAKAYGSTPYTPGWNPRCDITDPYEVVDIFDLVTLADNYGEEYIP